MDDRQIKQMSETYREVTRWQRFVKALRELDEWSFSWRGIEFNAWKPWKEITLSCALRVDIHNRLLTGQINLGVGGFTFEVPLKWRK